MVIEQYRNEKIYMVYREIFIDAAVKYQTLVFQEMIRLGYLNGSSPQAMAIYFYAPIFFFLNKYDQEPELEQEALDMLDKQVLEFRRIYGGQENE